MDDAKEGIGKDVDCVDVVEDPILSRNSFWNPECLHIFLDWQTCAMRRHHLEQQGRKKTSPTTIIIIETPTQHYQRPTHAKMVKLTRRQLDGLKQYKYSGVDK